MAIAGSEQLSSGVKDDTAAASLAATQTPGNAILQQVNTANSGAVAANSASQGIAQQQLGINSAMYGTGGVLQNQEQQQYGYSAAQNQLSGQGIAAQQQYANISNPIEQQQYGLGQQAFQLQNSSTNPNSVYGLGQQSAQLGQQALQQQLAQNTNEFGQQVQGQNAAAGASGATNTAGERNAQNQINLTYGANGYNAQNINRSLAQGQLGIQSSQEQNQIAQLGNQQTQLGQTQTLAQQNLQNKQLQEAAAANGISGQELLSGLQSGQQATGLQGQQSAQGILQGVAQGVGTLDATTASDYSQIAAAGGIGNLFGGGS